MNTLLNLWKTQPTLVVGFVTAILDLLIAFGVPLSPDQRLQIIGVVTAFLALLGAGIIHSQVTPVASPSLPSGTTVAVTSDTQPTAKVTV